MNKKNRYIIPSEKKNLDSLTLWFMFFPKDNPGEKARRLWQEHRDAFLEAWIELFPATRPRLWWVLEHRDIYDRLCATEQERIALSEFPALKAYPDLDEAKQELLMMGELDSDEIYADPVPGELKRLVEYFKVAVL